MLHRHDDREGSGAERWPVLLVKILRGDPAVSNFIGRNELAKGALTMSFFLLVFNKSCPRDFRSGPESAYGGRARSGGRGS